MKLEPQDIVLYRGEKHEVVCDGKGKTAVIKKVGDNKHFTVQKNTVELLYTWEDNEVDNWIQNDPDLYFAYRAASRAEKAGICMDVAMKTDGINPSRVDPDRIYENL